MKVKAPRISVTERLRSERRSAQYYLVLTPHLCVVDLLGNRGRLDDWHHLNIRLVYGLTVARLFFNQEAVTELYIALQSLSSVHCTIPGRDNRWFVTPEEAFDLGRGLALTDEMESLCSHSESRHAMAEALKIL